MERVSSIREALEKLEIKACLFDMDGLIFDTERVFMEQLSVVMAEYGYTLTREIYCETLGMAGNALREKMESHYGISYPFLEIGRKARERVGRIAESVGLSVKPEIPQVLACLRERKIPCAVASGTKSNIAEEYLDITGLREYFEIVVGGEQVAQAKPAPDIFLLAAEGLGAAPADCVVLEDSENGVTAGKAAGCTVICVPDLQQPCKALFEKIDYLVQRPQWI